MSSLYGSFKSIALEFRFTPLEDDLQNMENEKLKAWEGGWVASRVVVGRHGLAGLLALICFECSRLQEVHITMRERLFWTGD
jgi:hypothetical protein